jgi:quercetin dioxygenase-like cupin family protein
MRVKGVKGARPLAIVASAVMIGLAFASTALGTVPEGIVSGPILARGDFTEQVDVKVKFRRDGSINVSNAPGAGEVVVQEITIAPGGTTGWLSHPGPVVVVVKQGALTYVRVAGGECVDTTYGAGSAFVDPGQGHVHTAFNMGSENLVLYATYFDVPAGGSPRIDVPVAPSACS